MLTSRYTPLKLNSSVLKNDQETQIRKGIIFQSHPFFQGANSLWKISGGVHARKNLQLLRPFGDMKGLGSWDPPRSPGLNGRGLHHQLRGSEGYCTASNVGRWGCGGWGQPPVGLILAESAKSDQPKEMLIFVHGCRNCKVFCFFLDEIERWDHEIIDLRYCEKLRFFSRNSLASLLTQSNWATFAINLPWPHPSLGQIASQVIDLSLPWSPGFILQAESYPELHQPAFLPAKLAILARAFLNYLWLSSLVLRFFNLLKGAMKQQGPLIV